MENILFFAAAICLAAIKRSPYPYHPKMYKGWNIDLMLHFPVEDKL